MIHGRMSVGFLYEKSGRGRCVFHRLIHPAFEQDVYYAMSLKACVEGRSIPGGPAPAAVQASIDEAREQLKAASIA